MTRLGEQTIKLPTDEKLTSADDFTVEFKKNKKLMSMMDEIN